VSPSEKDMLTIELYRNLDEEKKCANNVQTENEDHLELELILLFNDYSIVLSFCWFLLK
jgi:hypothetical protein